MADERLEFFAKGYKKGLEEAWNEIMKEGSSGYSITELRMVLKAKMSTIDRRVEAQVNLLRNELGIEEEKEGGSSGPEELIEGCSYLVKEPRPKISFLLFDHLMKREHPGLCISRQSKDIILRRHRIGDFTHIKLGTSESESMPTSALGVGGSVSATANLTKLYGKITNFMERNPGAVILMDGTVEYLITENDFQKVLKFIQKLNDVVERTSAYLFIGISPDSLKKQDMAALERETTDTFSEDDA